MGGGGVVFWVSRELQFGVCSHDKPHATSCTVGEGDFLYRGKRSLEGLYSMVYDFSLAELLPQESVLPIGLCYCHSVWELPLLASWFYLIEGFVYLLLLFSHSVVSDSETWWTAAHQASLSFTISWSLLKLISIESMMPSNHLILCQPRLLLPSIFPRIRVFPSKSVLRIKWPKYWSFSFNISPSNEYSRLFPLGVTGLISLRSKGLLRVFSNTTVQKHQFAY